MSRCSRRHLLQGLTPLLALAHPACRAAAEPASVCGSAAPPAYPAADKTALVQSWLQGGRQDGALPDCSTLRGRDFELLVRVTASFNAPGDLDSQLVRCGAVSALKGASYWSFTDQKRLVLFREAFAVDSATSIKPRADFSAAELRSGSEMVFVHSDNRSSQLAPYSMRLASATADRFTLQVENLSDMRMFGLLLVAAHETQWAVSIERLGAGRWGYRSLLGQRHLRMGRAEQHRLSNLARSVALFDVLSGRQTEIEAYR